MLLLYRAGVLAPACGSGADRFKMAPVE